MVVDDQDAIIAHALRHLDDERRAGVLARLDLERAAEQRDALAHARSRPKPPSRASRRDRSRGRRPRSRADTMPSLRVEHDAHVPGLGVLDDVRQRLLHDPVERRLDLGRQAAVAEIGLDLDRGSRLLARTSRRAARARARGRSRRAPSGAARPRAGARPGACDDELAHALPRPRAAPASSRLLLERPEAEQDRRQRLAGLVVQLAREPAALELLRGDDAAERVARDALARGRPRRRRGSRTSRPAAGRRR